MTPMRWALLALWIACMLRTFFGALIGTIRTARARYTCGCCGDFVGWFAMPPRALFYVIVIPIACALVWPLTEIAGILTLRRMEQGKIAPPW